MSSNAIQLSADGPVVYSFDTPDEWLAALAERVWQAVEGAVAARGGAHIALAGGETPRPLYSGLASLQLPWEKIHWWIGDERCVPPDEAHSNERMIRQSFAASGAAPQPFRLHSWHGDPHMAAEAIADPVRAAAAYETLLKKVAGATPALDLVLLGLGADGHTASLFPETAALEEKAHLCVANSVPAVKGMRWTITYPLLARAREVVFVVQGEAKAARVEQIAEGDLSIPAARVRGERVAVFWLRTE